jgi:hypothetical protein
MRMRVCVCMYAYIFLCVFIYVCVCIYVGCMWVCVCTYVFVCVCGWVCVCVCVYTRICKPENRARHKSDTNNLIYESNLMTCFKIASCMQKVFLVKEKREIARRTPYYVQRFLLWYFRVCKGGALKETQVTSCVLQLRVGQLFVVIKQLGLLTEKKAHVSLRCKADIFNWSLPHLFSSFVFRLCALVIFLCLFTPYLVFSFFFVFLFLFCERWTFPLHFSDGSNTGKKSKYY